MGSGNHFRTVSLVLGVVILAWSWFLPSLDEARRSRLLRRLLPRHRPAWLPLACLPSLLLIAYTWYRVAERPVAYGWVLAVILSPGLVKALWFLFRWDEARAWALDVFARPHRLTAMLWSVRLAGIALLLLGLLVY